MFALATLAGIGLSGLKWPVSPLRRSLVAFVLLLLATGESFHGWGSDPWRNTAGRIHRYLATSSWPGAVLELPIYQRREFHRNAGYLLASTVHWRPLVNGFGGFAPPDFDDNAHLAGGFPSVLTVAWLQEIGVGYVVIHLDRYGDHALRMLSELEKLERRRDLVLEFVEGPTRLYRVQPERSRAIEALAPRPILSQLRFVGGPAEGSVLRAARGLRQAFGFQSPERFIAYLESTNLESHLMLRFPVPMSGRFLDAATGEELQEVTVRASAAADPPARVYAPAGHVGRACRPTRRTMTKGSMPLQVWRSPRRAPASETGSSTGSSVTSWGGMANWRGTPRTRSASRTVCGTVSVVTQGPP